ncbi:energy-coupling factor ABC transporter permease [Chitinibacter fontanus]|uniref:Energy-coupling factor ABC transporter permease n=1 Tax=Chitinibacter fontanus TaxID=1737446 RepID=A0A7D5VCX9_9NEIS|nr:energy-coupling factor ABC transporter permease [Chitinibacter fontanus]QLI83100.1 energy-coupling factor ABC transporter permease [Chitinibacter fontanus]
MPALYTDTWLQLGWLLMGFGVIESARREPWQQSPANHITSWLASSVVILLLWQLKAQVQAGIAFHILGSSALCLIAGRRRALISISAILIIQALSAKLDWQSIGLIWLLKGALPIFITSALLSWAQQRLPLNYFVYIFFNCFCAAALSMWSYGLLHCLILAASGAYEWPFLFEEVLPYYFLMGWPEAFITGLNLTILVVWQPQWVCSFDDIKYLQKRD